MFNTNFLVYKRMPLVYTGKEMAAKRTNGKFANPHQTAYPTEDSKKFIEAMAMPGMSSSGALRVVNASKNVIRAANPDPGDPKHGLPGNNDHIIAYKKSRALRKLIDERKQLALQFCDVTPEMVLGATAMRAFASIDGAYDDEGNFDIKLARKSGAIHLLKRLKISRTGMFEAEFYSNESAQQQLANYLGMEFAPKDHTDDEASLKSGVEAVARAIAKDRGTEVTHEIRVEAWTRVAAWVQESKARYSPKAIEEVGKTYGG